VFSRLARRSLGTPSIVSASTAHIRACSESFTAELIELGQDRDDGVIGSLDGEVVEVLARGVGQRRRSPPDLDRAWRTRSA